MKTISIFYAQGRMEYIDRVLARVGVGGKMLNCSLALAEYI